MSLVTGQGKKKNIKVSKNKAKNTFHEISGSEKVFEATQMIRLSNQIHKIRSYPTSGFTNNLLIISYTIYMTYFPRGYIP